MNTGTTCRRSADRAVSPNMTMFVPCCIFFSLSVALHDLVDPYLSMEKAVEVWPIVFAVHRHGDVGPGDGKHRQLLRDYALHLTHEVASGLVVGRFLLLGQHG